MAAVSAQKSITKSYEKELSIFTAELRALHLALLDIKLRPEEKHIIFSDSKSALQAIQDITSTNTEVKKLFELHTEIRQTKQVIFCWVPSHIGIVGNEAADREAKAALGSPVSDHTIPAQDFLTKVTIYIKNKMENFWNDIILNKLKEVVPDLSEHYQISCNNRKDEVVVTRLRIGHSRFTHSYLLKGESAPECVACGTLFTIKHILIECIDFAEARKHFYNCNNLCTLFKTVSYDKILDFLREIGIYGKL